MIEDAVSLILLDARTASSGGPHHANAPQDGLQATVVLMCRVSCLPAFEFTSSHVLDQTGRPVPVHPEDISHGSFSQ